MTTRTYDMRAPDGAGWFKYVNILSAIGADTPAGSPLRENDYARLSLDAVYHPGVFTPADPRQPASNVSGNVLFENCYPSGAGWSGGFWPAVPHTGPVFGYKTEMNRRVLAGRSRLLSEVRGHNWNAAIDLAQVRQLAGLGTRTLHAVAQTANLIRGRGLRRLIRGDNRKLVWNDIARLWLEYVYGIRPTLSSAYGMAAVVSGAIRNPKPAVFSCSTGTYTVPLMSRWCTGVYLHQRGTMKASQKLKWKIPYTFPGLDVAHSLGLTNPALVLWDKTPFSFVVDWWWPVYQFLELRHLLPQLQGTEIRNLRFEGTLTDASDVLGYYDNRKVVDGWFQSNGVNHVRQFEFRRINTPLNSISVTLPSPVITLPEGYRLGSAIALASLAVERLSSLRKG